VNAYATSTGDADVQSVIRLADLTKCYGRIRALAGLSLEIPRGAVGLLGPNGAGKTTLIKVLLGLLEPDSGTASIAGFDPSTTSGRIALRRVIGYMPEGDCLLPGMNGVDLLSILGRLSGLSRRDSLMRAHETLDYVGLDEERYRDTDGYSTGMKQRLKLAQALVHDPEILLLDEPTNGLDPTGRREMLTLVHDLGHVHGKNVLFCSHLLQDVERTCDRVVILHRGREVAAGSIDELTGAEGTRVRVVVNEPDQLGVQLDGADLAWELDPEGSITVDLSGHGGGRGGDRVFQLARDAGTSVVAMTAVRSNLEDAFLAALSDEEESAT